MISKGGVPKINYLPQKSTTLLVGHTYRLIAISKLHTIHYSYLASNHHIQMLNSNLTFFGQLVQKDTMVALTGKFAGPL